MSVLLSSVKHTSCVIIFHIYSTQWPEDDITATTVSVIALYKEVPAERMLYACLVVEATMCGLLCWTEWAPLHIAALVVVPWDATTPMILSATIRLRESKRPFDYLNELLNPWCMIWLSMGVRVCAKWRVGDGWTQSGICILDQRWFALMKEVSNKRCLAMWLGSVE